MPKNENSTSSGSITVTLSEQSIRVLEQLARQGIFGKNKAEVAARFIDRVLETYVQIPRLKISKR